MASFHDMNERHLSVSRQTSVYESVIGPYDDSPDSIRYAYNTLTGQSLTDGQFEAENRVLFARAMMHQGLDPRSQGLEIPEGPTDRTMGERMALMRELFDLHFHAEPTNINPMFDWATYNWITEGCGKRLSGGRALALGAQTALSARAFERMAQEIYGADEAHIIDIVSGADKKRHGIFTFGDARRLPFGDETMDVIQTSELFRHTFDPKGGRINPREAMEAVLPEAHRVLKRGGQMVLRESMQLPPFPREGDHLAEAKRRITIGHEYYTSAFARAGFDQVVVAAFVEPPTVDHLFDPDRDFRAHRWQPVPDTFMIHAIK